MMLHFLPLLFRPKNGGSVYCICVVYDTVNVALNMLHLSVLNHVIDFTFELVAGRMKKKQKKTVIHSKTEIRNEQAFQCGYLKTYLGHSNL